ncbi:hypothetical protein CHELA40_14311 [Chelatococcus asaccharovorans]|nr:hypothetical protein CHELA17_61309 [Chelatococcus asaccharovorans]CAH1676648.1 hypothetical protein CHELA40_14311 [Chelatococcus asaccharovorans]
MQASSFLRLLGTVLSHWRQHMCFAFWHLGLPNDQPAKLSLLA